jgi:hypothetical protein
VFPLTERFLMMLMATGKTEILKRIMNSATKQAADTF